MTKKVHFSPSFNKVHKDPSKNYGVGAVQCVMVLRGKEGAVHFSFSTGMYLPSVYQYWEGKGLHLDPNRPDYMGYNVGYCSPFPHFEGQSISQEKCPWINAPCYCDGSALASEKYMDTLVAEGSDAVWKKLKELYKDYFSPNPTT